MTRRWTIRARRGVAAGAIAGGLLSALVAAPPADAQRRPLVNRSAWVGAALIAGAALLDAGARDYALARRTPALDDVADAGNALGTGRYLIAGMAAAYGAGRLAGQREWSTSVVHVALAYAAGNAVGSALKPLVGRRRPYAAGDPAHFRPLNGSGEWHSFPSAHAIHAFSLAAAIAEEARRPWVSALGYGGAAVVAWQRVYVDQHWLSDVVAGGVLGALTAKAAVRWLHGREDRGGPGLELGVVPANGGAALVVSLPTRGAHALRRAGSPKEVPNRSE